MVSVLVPGASWRSGFKPWPGALLCTWARHLTLTVPLSTQEYKWVPANCWGNLTNCGGNDLRWTSIPFRGGRNTPSHSMLQKPGISSGSYDPVGSKASFFFFDKRIHFFFSSSTCLLMCPLIYVTEELREL